jgi:hypothetical protein
MSEWSHLTNAHHIDWVIASAKQHPEIWTAARGAARGAAWDAARDAAWNVARDAIYALISYDDCAHLLDMSSEQLKTWALLSEQPAAALLLPAVIARESIAQLESLQT